MTKFENFIDWVLYIFAILQLWNGEYHTTLLIIIVALLYRLRIEVREYFKENETNGNKQ